MKHKIPMAVAASALLVFGAVAAKADCADEIAALSHQGISKDGSLAPLASGTGARVGEGDNQENRAEPTARNSQGSTSASPSASGAGAVGEADEQRNRAEPSASDSQQVPSSGDAPTGTGPAVGEADAQTNRAKPDSAGNVAKDGSTAPMQEQGDAQVGTAMSGEDAQAQQSRSSGTDSTAPQRVAALERARAALERGDEEACMAAVEEAQAS